MEVDTAILREFYLETVQYDGWVELTHRFQNCDWTTDVACDSLLVVVQQALDHAGNCDGTPQPRTPPGEAPSGELIPALASSWAQEILRQAERSIRI